MISRNILAAAQPGKPTRLSFHEKAQPMVSKEVAGAYGDRDLFATARPGDPCDQSILSAGNDPKSTRNHI